MGSNTADGRRRYLTAVARRAVPVVVTAVATVIAACGGQVSAPGGADATSTVRGLVVGVDARSLEELDALTVSDGSGRQWYFVARGYEGFTPSHLKQHMLLGDPVAVVFHEDGDELVIDEVSD